MLKAKNIAGAFALLSLWLFLGIDPFTQSLQRQLSKMLGISFGLRSVELLLSGESPSGSFVVTNLIGQAEYQIYGDPEFRPLKEGEILPANVAVRTASDGKIVFNSVNGEFDRIEMDSSSFLVFKKRSQGSELYFVLLGGFVELMREKVGAQNNLSKFIAIDPESGEEFRSGNQPRYRLFSTYQGMWSSVMRARSDLSATKDGYVLLKHFSDSTEAPALPAVEAPPEAPAPVVVQTPTIEKVEPVVEPKAAPEPDLAKEKVESVAEPVAKAEAPKREEEKAVASPEAVALAPATSAAAVATSDSAVPRKKEKKKKKRDREGRQRETEERSSLAERREGQDFGATATATRLEKADVAAKNLPPAGSSPKENLDAKSREVAAAATIQRSNASTNSTEIMFNSALERSLNELILSKVKAGDCQGARDILVNSKAGFKDDPQYDEWQRRWKDRIKKAQCSR